MCYNYGYRIQYNTAILSFWSIYAKIKYTNFKTIGA